MNTEPGASKVPASGKDSKLKAVRDLNDPSLYINRELSLLRFHKRVLAQASDETVPLLERIRFLTITNSILDEFFEIRASGLKEQIAFGYFKSGPDGLGPQAQMDRLRPEVLKLVQEQYRLLNEVLLPELAAQGIAIYRRKHWSDVQKDWIQEYFLREVLPVLTPVGLDPAHPFPRILNKSLNFIVTLDGKDAFGRKSRAAIVQAPRILPRIVPLPDDVSGDPHGFVLISSVIHAHMEELFPGMKITGCHQFRVTRNSDLWVDEEEVEDLMSALKGELPQREFSKAVRLEVADTCPQEMALFLQNQFNLGEADTYEVDGPVNLNRLSALVDLVDRPELKYRLFTPGIPAKLAHKSDLFGVLRNGDVLLHHPYQSFGPVVDLIRQAAADPNVLAIRQTVYRTGVDSPMAEALLDAARSGKEVTAVVELRARFDEAANIDLATRLQEAGAKVVYGVVGFKAHAKMLLIVRREGTELVRYVHLGTGNYHSSTARTYTDFGLMTSDQKIGEDVHDVFQQLTGVCKAHTLNRCVQTPFELHGRLLEMIETEAAAAAAGEKARIVAKMNSLIEPEIIRALYRASMAGVKIDLIVRGVCCLRPGIPGVSDNIRVRSVVGRFLEHHRIFHFHAAGEEDTLCSSADWMPRNFFRRVELAFPIRSKKLRRRVIEEGLQVLLDDNCNAWEMDASGDYTRIQPGKNDDWISGQDALLRQLALKQG
ncbi:MAG: polyphosphate kinase 1 [Acidobacteria bacterium]|uniref:Polyphosphate kinase n=1 Tax=Candidatus Polarisedimenticola svalbardensis TaxID=2886004 RepID=A0A8J6Y1H4_9BACT|nr:polyphosphate kinase 1 [Candidatus Polarisedimenticola svalbardensis]